MTGSRVGLVSDTLKSAFKRSWWVLGVFCIDPQRSRRWRKNFAGEILGIHPICTVFPWSLRFQISTRCLYCIVRYGIYCSVHLVTPFFCVATPTYMLLFVLQAVMLCCCTGRHWEYKMKTFFWKDADSGLKIQMKNAFAVLRLIMTKNLVSRGIAWPSGTVPIIWAVHLLYSRT